MNFMSKQDRHCEGKNAYENHALARKALSNQLKYKRNNKKGWKETRLSIYRCRFCSLWHVGNVIKTSVKGHRAVLIGDGKRATR